MSKKKENSPVTAYIGFGANLGEPLAMFKRAKKALREAEGIFFCRASKLYWTEPLSNIPQPKFLNAVFEVQTTLSVHALFFEMERIEHALGKVKKPKDAPRTVDLDLLLYGHMQLQENGLTVPHPRMWERDFVLRPLSDLILQHVTI